MKVTMPDYRNINKKENAVRTVTIQWYCEGMARRWILGGSYDFRIPTTVAEFGSSLYAVNARFDTPPQPGTEYEVVGVPKH